MKRTLAFILVGLLICSCKNNKITLPERPDNLISEDKMVEVLYDMALVSAAKGVNKRIMENKGIYPQSYIYNKHGIDSMQFAISNEYYSYDIRTYQELYDRVRLKLEADKQEFNKSIQKKKTTRDSISEINRRRRDSIIKADTEAAKYGF